MLKTIRNMLIAAFALLALAVGSGLVYVYMNGGQENKQVLNAASDKTDEQFIPPKPSKPNPNAPVGASVVSIHTPVKAGSNTALTVKTTATATCTIAVAYGQPGSETQSSDSGLKPKVADEFGNVTWSWTVDKSVPTGKGTAKVTCKYGKKSGYVEGYLEIKAGG